MRSPTSTGWRGLVGRTNGGMIVHLGVILVAVAFAASNSYLRQSEFTIEQGESVEFADRTYRFDGIETEQLPEKRVTSAVIFVDDEELRPAINQFVVGTTIGTPDTAGSFTLDIQVALIALPDEDGDAVVIRVTSQPLIAWLWIGGILIAVGTVFAAFPHRIHRRPDRQIVDSVTVKVTDVVAVVALAKDDWGFDEGVRQLEIFDENKPFGGIALHCLAWHRHDPIARFRDDVEFGAHPRLKFEIRVFNLKNALHRAGLTIGGHSVSRECGFDNLIAQRGNTDAGFRPDFRCRGLLLGNPRHGPHLAAV